MKTMDGAYDPANPTDEEQNTSRRVTRSRSSSLKAKASELVKVNPKRKPLVRSRSQSKSEETAVAPKVETPSPFATTAATRVATRSFHTSTPKPSPSQEKGKIKFSIKRLRTSLVQYSDEDSIQSEKEDDKNDKEGEKNESVPKESVSLQIPDVGISDKPVAIVEDRIELICDDDVIIVPDTDEHEAPVEKLSQAGEDSPEIIEIDEEIETPDAKKMKICTKDPIISAENIVVNLADIQLPPMEAKVPMKEDKAIIKDCPSVLENIKKTETCASVKEITPPANTAVSEEIIEIPPVKASKPKDNKQSQVEEVGIKTIHHDTQNNSTTCDLQNIVLPPSAKAQPTDVTLEGEEGENKAKSTAETFAISAVVKNISREIPETVKPNQVSSSSTQLPDDTKKLLHAREKEDIKLEAIHMPVPAMDLPAMDILISPIVAEPISKEKRSKSTEKPGKGLKLRFKQTRKLLKPVELEPKTPEKEDVDPLKLYDFEDDDLEMEKPLKEIQQSIREVRVETKPKDIGPVLLASKEVKHDSSTEVQHAHREDDAGKPQRRRERKSRWSKISESHDDGPTNPAKIPVQQSVESEEPRKRDAEEIKGKIDKDVDFLMKKVQLNLQNSGSERKDKTAENVNGDKKTDIDKSPEHRKQQESPEPSRKQRQEFADEKAIEQWPPVVPKSQKIASVKPPSKQTLSTDHATDSDSDSSSSSSSSGSSTTSSSSSSYSSAPDGETDKHESRAVEKEKHTLGTGHNTPISLYSPSRPSPDDDMEVDPVPQASEMSQERSTTEAQGPVSAEIDDVPLPPNFLPHPEQTSDRNVSRNPPHGSVHAKDTPTAQCSNQLSGTEESAKMILPPKKSHFIGNVTALTITREEQPWLAPDQLDRSTVSDVASVSKEVTSDDVSSKQAPDRLAPTPEMIMETDPRISIEGFQAAQRITSHTTETIKETLPERLDVQTHREAENPMHAVNQTKANRTSIEMARPAFPISAIQHVAPIPVVGGPTALPSSKLLDNVTNVAMATEQYGHDELPGSLQTTEDVPCAELVTKPDTSTVDTGKRVLSDTQETSRNRDKEEGNSYILKNKDPILDRSPGRERDQAPDGNKDLDPERTRDLGPDSNQDLDRSRERDRTQNPDRSHELDRGGDRDRSRDQDRHREKEKDKDHNRTASRRNRSRDRDRERERDKDRDKDRHRRHRRSRSREHRSPSRSRDKRSKSRERERRSRSKDYRSGSRSRDRRSRSKERRSRSRDRDQTSRSKDKVLRSHDRRSRSRDRRRSRSRDRRSRSRDRRRSRSRERRRSRSRDRHYERDRYYDRERNRHRRRSVSHDRDERRRYDRRESQRSGSHSRDDSRSRAERDRTHGQQGGSLLELDSIPLPPTDLGLPAGQVFSPAPIPTITQAYKGGLVNSDYGSEVESTPIGTDPLLSAGQQPSNLIYPPTIEMNYNSDIESVDMEDDLMDTEQCQRSPPVPGQQTDEPQPIRVISGTHATAEKSAAGRVAFSMKTMPKKSALFRRAALGAFEEDLEPVARSLPIISQADRDAAPVPTPCFEPRLLAPQSYQPAPSAETSEYGTSAPVAPVFEHPPSMGSQPGMSDITAVPLPQIPFAVPPFIQKPSDQAPAQPLQAPASTTAVGGFQDLGMIPLPAAPAGSNPVPNEPQHKQVSGMFTGLPSALTDLFKKSISSIGSFPNTQPSAIKEYAQQLLGNLPDSSTAPPKQTSPSMLPMPFPHASQTLVTTTLVSPVSRPQKTSPIEPSKKEHDSTVRPVPSETQPWLSPSRGYTARPLESKSGLEKVPDYMMHYGDTESGECSKHDTRERSQHHSMELKDSENAGDTEEPNEQNRQEDSQKDEENKDDDRKGRRRSSRLKTLEEKKEPDKKDTPKRESKKKARKAKKQEEKLDDKVSEQPVEATPLFVETEADVAPPTENYTVHGVLPAEFLSPGSKDPPKKDESSPLKPIKVKSRWRRWSELEATAAEHTNQQPVPPPPPSVVPPPPAAAAEIKDERIDSEKSDFKVPIPVPAPEPSMIVPPPPHTILASISEESEAAPESPKDQEASEVKVEELEPGKEEPKDVVPPKLPAFEQILDNLFLSERKKSKARSKEVRRMVCDCPLPTREEFLAGMRPCGEDCLNRMLFIECSSSRCPCGEWCTNRRFQKHKYSKVEPFHAGDKGWGLQAKAKIDGGAFIMEYVGEVLDYREFRRRTKEYSVNNQSHFYFMALNTDEVIDATNKGNSSRFINHSCDPNCETQKWTVNGQLRIGFFSIKPLAQGEELTFDYQFERYGEEAQKCYCGTAKCRGFIGTSKKSSPFKDYLNKPIKKEKRKVFDDVMLEEEIEKMLEFEGLRRRDHVLELARLMVRAESTDHRMSLLKIIQDTKEQACLRLFLEYHGLSLLWSWMVDMTSHGSIKFKTEVLKALKCLPITNKTILQDSNVLSVVERWAVEISEAKKEEAKEEASESSSSGRGTPVVSSKDAPVTDAPSGGLMEKYEGIPSKKRRLLQRLQEEASSSDGDAGSDTGKKSQEATSAREDTDSQTGDQDTKESESEVETGPDSGKGAEDDNLQEGDVCDIAGELIGAWSHLKEVFKIPKIQVEERKKTERELEQRYSDKKERDYKSSSLSVLGRKRQPEDSPDWGRSLRDDKRRRQPDKDDDVKIIKPRWSGMKTLLPTPPRMSKEQRRKVFEAQVKAQDDMKHQERMSQMEQWLPPGFPGYDPSNPFPDVGNPYTDPNMPGFPPLDPNVPAIYPDPNVPVYPVDHGSVFQRPPPEFPDPNIPPHPGQVVNMPGQPQLLLQPDGSYLPSPQMPVPGYPPPPTPILVEQSLPTSTIPQGSYLESSQPQLIFQPAASQPTYQAPPPVQQTFIQHPAPAATTTVSYASTPLQQQQQGAPHYVQAVPSQPVQQVFYTTPQGQVLVQQQPVVQPPVLQQPVVQQPQPVIQQPPIVQQSPVVQPPPMVQQSIFPGPSSSHSVPIGEPPGQMRPIPGVGPRDPREPPPPPPLSPPKSKRKRLPPNWKTAKDADNKVYYYHTVTRQTQWEPPAWEGEIDDDFGTPTHDEPKSKKKTTTAAADTSTETAKRIKDHFRMKISKLIVLYLNPFRRPDCKLGRITNTDDFKHLARKLTHTVLDKELKHCRHLEDLEVNENVKAKTKDFIKKYMIRFGPVYKKSSSSP